MTEYRAPGGTWTSELTGGTGGTAASYTVALLNADTGAIVIAASNTGVAEIDAPSGNYKKTFTLPTTAARYQAEWIKGAVKVLDDSIVEVTLAPPSPSGVTDAPYFTPAEFKLKYTTNSQVQALTDDEIDAARLTAEEIIEHECHVAFVPRPKTITLSGEGVTRSSIPLYLIREITSVTVDGYTQTVDDTYRIGTGAIYRTTAWTRGVSNVVIALEHGYDAPPRWIRDAAMTLTFHRAIKGPIDDRATSIPAGEAGGVINLLTPGVGAAITGIPDVDAAIIAHRLPPIGSVSSVPTADSANTYPSELDTFAIG